MFRAVGRLFGSHCSKSFMSCKPSADAEGMMDSNGVCGTMESGTAASDTRK